MPNPIFPLCLIGAGLAMLDSEDKKELPKRPISWVEHPLGMIDQIRDAKDRTFIGKSWSHISSFAAVSIGVATTCLISSALWNPSVMLKGRPDLFKLAVLLVVPFVVGGTAGTATLVGFEFSGDMVRRTSEVILSLF